MRPQDDGIFGVAIYPPTVLRGTARIRLSLNAGHTDTDVEHLVEAIWSKPSAAFPAAAKADLFGTGHSR